jgi:hypothetical protein
MWVLMIKKNRGSKILRDCPITVYSILYTVKWKFSYENISCLRKNYENIWPPVVSNEDAVKIIL